MNMNCADRERIFLDGSTEEWAALQEHAAACRECGEEVRAWRALSVTAKELQEEQQSPLLWNRIESSLREQMAQAKEPRKRIWSLLDFWRDVPMAWQTALAAVLVLALTLAGGYLYTRRSAPVNNAGNQLLKTPALAEVERTEREYTQAIDKLAVSAKPTGFSHLAAYGQLPREAHVVGWRHRGTSHASRAESFECSSSLPIARDVPTETGNTSGSFGD
jgi:hypothetical protein